MKFLVVGALPENEELLQLYSAVKEVLSEFGETLSTPADTMHFQGTPEERYQRGFDTVTSSNIVIAEASQPSTGQGMEIRDAEVKGKRVIVIAKEGSKVSGMVKGCPAVETIIFYKSLDDLKEKLHKAIVDTIQ